MGQNEIISVKFSIHSTEPEPKNEARSKYIAIAEMEEKSWGCGSEIEEVVGGEYLITRLSPHTNPLRQSEKTNTSRPTASPCIVIRPPARRSDLEQDVQCGRTADKVSLASDTQALWTCLGEKQHPNLLYWVCFYALNLT